MTSRTFDTLAYVKRLKAAGPDAQAEAQAEALAAAAGTELATRADLENALIKLESRIAAVDARMTTMQWMLGFVLAFLVTILFKIFS